MRRSDETTDSDGPRCRRFRVDFDKMSRLTRWMASNTPTVYTRNIVVYYPVSALNVMPDHVGISHKITVIYVAAKKKIKYLFKLQTKVKG